MEFNDLTEEQKDLVGNVDDLTQAEQTYKQEKNKANQAEREKNAKKKGPSGAVIALILVGIADLALVVACCVLIVLNKKDGVGNVVLSQRSKKK